MSLSFAPSVGAACTSEAAGIILAPFPGPTPPPFHQGSGGHPLIVFHLTNIVQGQPFWLYAGQNNQPIGPCLDAHCLYAPDFNVAFFKIEGSLLHTQVGSTYNAPGPDHGDVPVEADYATVWMRTGLETAGVDGNPVRGRFIFAQGCTGTPW